MAVVTSHMDEDQLKEYYKMPPVGITECRSRIGAAVKLQYTSRCGSSRCWFVGNAATSGDAKTLLDEHECPTPPRRNELPTGYSTLEKLWDELDEVTWAICEGESYMVGKQQMQSTALQGYARGIAFALSMMTHPYFRTMDDVVREARDRYRIRKGTLEYRPTPGYRFNPSFSPPPNPPEGIREPWMGATAAYTPKRPTQKVRGRAASKPAAVDLRNIDSAKANQIKTARALGMFTDEELAQQYEITVDAVKALCGG